MAAWQQERSGSTLGWTRRDPIELNGDRASERAEDAQILTRPTFGVLGCRTTHVSRYNTYVHMPWPAVNAQWVGPRLGGPSLLRVLWSPDGGIQSALGLRLSQIIPHIFPIFRWAVNIQHCFQYLGRFPRHVELTSVPVSPCAQLAAYGAAP